MESAQLQYSHQFNNRYCGSPTCHVSLYPVPFSINLAESLNSYATDGAITVIQLQDSKTPKKVKNADRILLFIFYPLIDATAITGTSDKRENVIFPI